MVKHTQTIRRQFELTAVDHFVILVLKGLRILRQNNIFNEKKGG